MQDIIHWKYPALSFAVLVGYWAAVLTFQPFMITMSLIPLLIMGKVAPGLFIKHEGAAKKGKVKQEKPKDEKQGALEQTKNLHKMAIDVQKILDFIVGLLEKGFHTFIWIRPQATFTLCIALSLSKLFNQNFNPENPNPKNSNSETQTNIEFLSSNSAVHDLEWKCQKNF